MPDANPEPIIDPEILSALNTMVDHARERVEVALQIAEFLHHDYRPDPAERAAIELLTVSGTTADLWRDLRSELRFASDELDDAAFHLADLESRLDDCDVIPFPTPDREATP